MNALDRFNSIKVKLGVLVAASVVVASLVALLGSSAGVPAWLTLPVTLLLALALTQLLAGGMVAPLREMTHAAQAMARGDYGVRVVTGNTDEVGRLARSFNVMAADLERVDVERRDLIATVSHELRTPVAALSAQLENLADGVVGATPERLGATYATVERLGDLLGDLLALSRLEAGVVDLDPERVVLAGLLRECAHEVGEAGRAAPVQVRVPEDLVVDVDRARMRQLLVNVLDNAVRHAPGGTSVVVVAGAAPEGWWLEVLDSGPGVAPEDRERVFERFGTDADGGGTGVGLAISRWVARLHGGALEFIDPGPARSGARLRLMVPAPGPAPAMVPASETAAVLAEAPRPDQSNGPVGADTWAVLTAGRWVETKPAGSPRLLLAATAVGVLAAASLVGSLPGLVWALVLMAAGSVAWAASGRRRTEPFLLLCTVLATAAVGGMAVHSHPAVVALAVIAAAGTFLIGLTDARTLPGMFVTGLAWPASTLRGLEWLSRSVRVGRGTRRMAVLRTTGVTLLGVVVFGFLLVSADAVLVDWVDRLVPDVRVDEYVGRSFVAVAVSGMTLAAAYLARNPPEVDPRRRPRTAARNRWEWVLPVVAVVLVFMVFLAVQVVTALGGDAYVGRTVGLTYSEYARQGFFQLLLATGLALVVVWAAGRRAGEGAEDRKWLLGCTGALCVAVLGVVVTALGKLVVYQGAYGFTVPRVIAFLVEGWLGFVVVALMVTGILGRTRWLPRTALISGTVVVVALSWFNTAGWVAERNIDRFETTGKLDVDHLAQLGAGALPVVVERLDPELAACVVRQGPYGVQGTSTDWSSWTWDRRAARAALAELGDLDVGELANCDSAEALREVQ